MQPRRDISAHVVCNTIADGHVRSVSIVVYQYPRLCADTRRSGDLIEVCVPEAAYVVVCTNTKTYDTLLWCAPRKGIRSGDLGQV